MLVNIIQNTISSFRSALAAASVITTNLKMWLGFETSSIDGDSQITPDKSGNNNVGELFTGKALDFNGITEEVDVSGFQMSGAIATFAFWIYPRDTRYQFIMDNKLSSGNADRTIIALFQLNSDPQKFGFYNYPAGFKQFGTPTQNQWQRVVFRVNATTVECYVDGVKSGSTETLATSIDLSATVTANIASKSGSGSARNLDAKLSDFQIYNAYWSTDDIDFDYANPNKLAIDNPSTSLNVTNLKAYWALSEGDGLVAYDSGTNLEEEEVQNGTFNLGSEEVTNGDFSDGFDDWSNGSSWSVANNVATLASSNDATNSTLTSSATLVSSKTYVLTYTILNYGGGELALVNGNVSIPSTNGNKTFTFTDQTELSVKRKGGATALSITNISVKEVPNWVFGDGWSVGDNNKITRTAQSGSTSATQNISFVSGKSYSITYTLDVSAGSFLIRLGGKSVLDTPARSVSDTYTEVITATSNHTIFNLRAYNGLFAGSISNVSVREVTASDHGGIINGAEYVDAQPRIPQLGMQNWAKSTPVADEITLIPNPTIPTQDILGNAVRDRLNSFNLDGSGYAVNETLPTISGNISLSFWVKLDTFASGNLGQILGKREGSSWLRVYRNSASQLSLEVAAQDAITFSVTENQWVYVAITINSSNEASVYVDDSAAIGATLGTSFSFINTEVFAVGAWLNPALIANSKLNGLVSDVLIYDRVLTSKEVENNYNAGLSAHTN